MKAKTSRDLRSRLIAAAPDMLKALKVIAAREGDSITGKLARAVAAKAEFDE